MRLELEEKFVIRNKEIYRERGYEGFDDDAVEFFENDSSRERRKRRFSKNGDEGQVEAGKKKKKKVQNETGESLLAKDLELSQKAGEQDTSKPAEVVDKKKEIVWYHELPKQLVEVTGYKRKEESDEDFLKRREGALKSLEEKIPNIRSVIDEFGPQVHWAGKILGGSRDITPWGDPQKGLDFLKNELGVEKKNLENGEKKSKNEKVVVVQKEERIKNELSFEDKAKLVDEADYGGVLFPAYKKYVNGDPLPVGLNVDNVLFQVRSLFPTFDARAFAVEARQKALEQKVAAEPVNRVEGDWRESLKTDPLLMNLAKAAEPAKWQEKVERLSGMSESDREKELLVLRWLAMKKDQDLSGEVSGGIWDRHKVRLANLGVL